MQTTCCPADESMVVLLRTVRPPEYHNARGIRCCGLEVATVEEWMSGGLENQGLLCSSTTTLPSIITGDYRIYAPVKKVH